MKKRYALSVLVMLINMSVGAGTVTTNLLYFGNDWDGAPEGGIRPLTQIVNNTNFVNNADDTWYRSGVEGAVAVSDSCTLNNRTPPPGVTGGVALRIGYANSGTTLAAQLALSESDWDNTVDTYRLTTVSRIAATDGSVTTPATGSVRVQLGYVLPAGTIGYNISEDVVIGTSGWTTNVQEIAGADLVGGNGKPIVLRVLNRLGNDAGHFTWVDSMKLEKLTVTIPPPTNAVTTDFKVSGGDTDASSIDLTWSNLTGTVTVSSSDTVSPVIDGSQNSFTSTTGVSGVIKVNVQALDSETNNVPFNPTTWSGGTQSAGNAIYSSASEGWGVGWVGQPDGGLQDTEALILTFDLSELSMAADQSLKLTGIAFNQGTGAGNGDVWIRDPDVLVGIPGAGASLANDVRYFTNSIEIVDGDQIALMRGSADTRLETLGMDIVSDSNKILGLSITAGGAGHVAVSTTNLTEDTAATLQVSTSLTSPEWMDADSAVSVSPGQWEVPTSSDSAFFCAQRKREIDNPRYGYRFYPVDDAFVTEEFPGSNYGSFEDMKVSDEADKQRIAYLKFVVDEVPDSIDEVWLKVNAGAAISSLAVREVSDNTWDEDTITWSNMPARGTLYTSKAVGNGWNTFDLSSYVTNAGTYSIALVSADTDNVTVWAKESVHNPVLEIVPTPDEPEKYKAVFGGGPLYGDLNDNLETMKASGFDTILLWAGKVQTDGSVNYNLSELKIIQNGQYAGDPDWPDELAALKTGTTSVTRVEMSLSAWGDKSFERIDDLIADEGIGEDSSLYQSFKVMRDVLGVDAINYDDEDHYDVASSVQFGIMLSTLGFKVTLCPYMNSSYWEAVYDQLNAYQPGLVDRVYLQCYAGGAGNTPAGWNGYFDGIQVSGSVWAGDGEAPPPEVQTIFSGWSSTSDGGFLWSLDNILRDTTNSVADYGNAVINGLD